MENASKALIMAGSVLIALMIIGLLVFMFSNLSNYQSSDTENKRESQVIEFNNQFETYARKDIRGSDMISLLNRVVDYNQRKTGATSQEQYQVMNIKVMGIQKTTSTILYADADKNLWFAGSEITQDTIQGVNKKVKDLEEKYQSKYITNLAKNISQVVDGADAQKVQKFLPKLIDTYGGLEKVQNDTKIYYQYSQFKRLYFDCDTNKTQYDSKTGRIIYMEFKCTNKLG